MGTWGTGITDNDTASEVYADYVSLLEIHSATQTMEKLVAFYRSKVESHEEQYHFWLAVAKAQLDTQTLQPDVFEKVKAIIVNEDDLRLWKELKASEADIQARQEVLNRFLNALTAASQSATE